MARGIWQNVDWSTLFGKILSGGGTSGPLPGSQPPTITGLSSEVVRPLDGASIPSLLDGDLAIANPDGTGFKGGSLTVHLDSATSGDDFTLSDGTFRIQGTTLYKGFLPVGTVTSDGQDGRDLVIKFSAFFTVSDAAVSALAEQISYSTSDAVASAGTRTLTLTVTDKEGQQAQGHLDLSVVSPNSAPNASDDFRSTAEDIPLSFAAAQLLANDTDPNGDALTVTGVGGATHGTVALASGQVIFTPDADFNGAASFTYTVTDGKGATDIAHVMVNVESVNDAPEIIDIPTPSTVSAAEGEVGNGDSDAYDMRFSDDGTKVLFFSAADNLVDGDTNGAYDLFVKDLETGAITLVSASSTGEPGDGYFYYESAAFSPDGTKVVFNSTAGNLVEGDGNGASDVFLKDLETGEITRLSGTATGGDGDGRAYGAQFSEDGTKVLFTSTSTNLVEGDTNNASDVLVKDLETGEITLVNTSSSGVAGNGTSHEAQFSPEGTKVLFRSMSSNLVEGDTNGTYDIFVKDLETGEITRVSTSTTGGEADSYSYGAQFSPDGTKVLFFSYASNLVEGDTNGAGDLFVRDLETGEITMVASSATGEAGNAGSNDYDATFSPDGTKVLFWSNSSNLVANDTNGTYDLFVKDLETGEVILVASSATGEASNKGAGSLAQFSSDGSKVVFFSAGTNLVAEDVGDGGVYVKDLETGEITFTGLPKVGDADNIVLSPDATTVVYAAPLNGVVEQTNGAYNLIAVDIATGDVEVVSSDAAYQDMLTRTGTITFEDPDPADTHTVTVTPAGGDLGTLSAHVTEVADGPDLVEWTYEVDRADLVPLNEGETWQDSFLVTIGDGHGGTTSATVVVNLEGINAQPIANTDIVATDTNTPLVLDMATLVANDTDLDQGDTLTVTSVESVSGGAVELTQDGQIIFTPNADFTGVARFSYQVSDGAGATNESYVLVDVGPSNVYDIGTAAGADFASAYDLSTLEFRYSTNTDLDGGYGSDGYGGPGATVEAVGTAGEWDTYKITVPKDNNLFYGVVFDIDYGDGSAGGFNSWLNLYDSSGNLIASSDDAPVTTGGTGSVSVHDAYLGHWGSGVYYLQVGEYDNQPLSQDASYTLQVKYIYELAN